MKNDGRKKVKVSYEIGHVFKKASSTFELVKLLDMRTNKKGNRQARYILIRCVDCGTEREALLASMSGGGGCVCRNCGPKHRLRTEKVDHYPNLEEKAQIMREINEIFEQMKRMAKDGTLVSYIVTKFNDRNGVDYYLQDEVEQQKNNDDDIDYGDQDIDWDNEINKYLDDE